MMSQRPREAGWFVYIEEAETRLELSTWLLFCKAVAFYTTPVLPLFLQE
jgi:hypothetical protein